MATKFTGDLILAAGSVGNAHISNVAADVLDCDKLEHLRKPGTNFALAIGGTPAAREEIVFVASTTGVIRGFHALLNDTGTSTSVTFDLKKNGTTCLSSVITITHAATDKAVSDGTLSVTTFAADDIISIQLAVSSSTGAQGPYAWVEIQETAAAS